MSAAIGLGLESQITVVMPSSVSEDLVGVTEVFCLGAGAEQFSLPSGLLDFNPGSLPTPADIEKYLQLSNMAPPLTDPAELLTMIESMISQWLSERGVAGLSANQSAERLALATNPKPSQVTQKEFVVKWPEYVWYPRDRGQDFVIQCALRVQMFKGAGGEKKWVRMIVDDSDNTAGFLNRGDLVFHTDHDKGYFISGAQVKLSTADSWVNFGGREPGHLNAGIAPDGPNDLLASDYAPSQSESRTSFDVDYVEGGTKKSWTSVESRQFWMDEFELNPEAGADWRWRLALCQTPDHGDKKPVKVRKLYYWSDKPPPGSVQQNWEAMAEMIPETALQFNHTQTIGWPMRMSRGTDQMEFHPKVQAWYWVPANETRSTKFTLSTSQEVWNVWSTEDDNHFRAVYSANIDRRITVDFNKLSAQVPLWATGTSGNPGATRVMQDDGNLVIISKDGKLLWAAGTGGNPGAYLKMQDDGNLVIYDRTALWSTGTSGNNGATRKMQSDGNLVIYSKDGRALWASNTSGNPGATLIMQDDGNLVILKDGHVLWAAGTGGHPGAYDVMQDDGNYVIYLDGPALWSSKTDGNPGAYDVMQGDGNYVIYSKQ